MKYIKILGLAAVALAALMAMSGTASATILTSPANTTYTSTIKAEHNWTEANPEYVTLTSVFGGFGAVKCKHSVVEGTVEGHGSAVTVTGKIKTLTFTECEGGTPRSPVAKPGSLEVHTEYETVTDKNGEVTHIQKTSATGNGTITSLGAEVIIDGTAFGTCTFTTSASGTDIGTLTGSKNNGNKTAKFDINASIASPCGTGTWEGSYEVVTPDYLDVD